MVKVRRALISVWDKKGISEFAQGLNQMGVEILSTGGTAELLKEAGVPIRSVADYTGFPEMLEGRVKTLHPKIHGALLALRSKPEHMEQIKNQGIEPIDMVVVNLYPFEKTVAKRDVKLEEAIENIDIGGPTMLRSGAKNFESVACICNPNRYEAILEELRENDCMLSYDTLASLACEVFEKTSRYDEAIYNFLKDKFPLGCNSSIAGSQFPGVLELEYDKVQDLRYGENPHQKAAFYKGKDLGQPSVAGAQQLHGKDLSFNNILDLNAAIEIAKEFDQPTASVIKHTNPCGCASAGELARAYKDALDCDPLSAFGSVVGLNRKVDPKTADEILGAGFVEAVIGPGYETKALEILKRKKDLRVISIPELGARIGGLDLREVVGGLLVQDRDIKDITLKEVKVLTDKKPTDEELDWLIFAWKVAKYVKSNAIVLAKGTKTVGIGAGQMSRVDSVIIACRKAEGRAKDSVLASDAFFPKRDGIDRAAQAGVCAIIQPGGSIRDEEVIAACNEHGMAMVFTGVRHFKH